MDRGSSLSLRGCLGFLMASIIGISLCTVTVYGGVEYSCNRDAKEWLVDYPDADLVSEEYSWLRAFGIGRTVRTLYTPDSKNDVIRWYAQHSRELTDQGKTQGDGFARIGWQYITGPDGEGTTIQLSSDCASDMELW